VQQYLAEWARLAPGEPIQNLTTLREITLATGAIEAALEVEVLTQQSTGDSLANAGGALLTTYLLEMLGSRLSGESWWVPLDLQARFGVTFSSLKNSQHQSGIQGIIMAISELGLEFCHNAESELLVLRQEKVDGRHLQVCLKIAERRMKNRIRRPHKMGSRGPTVAEVFIAWRGAIRRASPLRAED
jgi:hypothetical protein